MTDAVKPTGEQIEWAVNTFAALGVAWDDRVIIDRIARRLAEREAGRGAPEGYKLVPVAALKWLSGEGPDDNGNWFGDGADAKIGHGAYWWRKTFSRLLSAAPSPADRTEYGWVVEHRNSEVSRPHYWTGSGWSYDSLDALRFARQTDGVRALAGFDEDDPLPEEKSHRVCEHAWGGSRPSSPADRDEGGERE